MKIKPKYLKFNTRGMNFYKTENMFYRDKFEKLLRNDYAFRQMWGFSDDNDYNEKDFIAWIEDQKEIKYQKKKESEGDITKNCRNDRILMKRLKKGRIV